jgi:hypothetical protein
MDVFCCGVFPKGHEVVMFHKFQGDMFRRFSAGTISGAVHRAGTHAQHPEPAQFSR